MTKAGTRSLSLHLESNGKEEICRDEAGKPLTGTIITEDQFIHRFKNGLLDGSIEKDGIRIIQPAVEGPGHLEYWREGRLHQEQGLPAVISDHLGKREWWVNGDFLRKDYDE